MTPATPTPEQLSAGDAARVLSVGRRVPVARQTVRRWMLEGIVLRGTRVYLRYEQIGGRIWTTHEWLAEFRQACKGQPARALTPKEMAAYHRETARRGARIGLKIGA